MKKRILSEDEIYDLFCVEYRIDDPKKTNMKTHYQKSGPFAYYSLHIRLRELGQALCRALPSWIKKPLNIEV